MHFWSDTITPLSLSLAVIYGAALRCTMGPVSLHTGVPS